MIFPRNRHECFRKRVALFAALACLLLAGCGGRVENADGPLVVGARGSGPGRFSFPRGVDVAPDGRVAVADRTGRIQIFSAAGEPITQWFMPKYNNGTPTRLVFDATDPATTTLLVADTHNYRIIRYSLDGRIVQQFGKHGSKPGEMLFPTDIALDTSGTMYIAEYGAEYEDRIMVYSRSGRFIRQFGGYGEEPGKLQRPMGVVFVPPDRLIVADSCNDRLQVFRTDGTLLAVWGKVGKAPGEFNYPYDVALDKEGRVYVAEWGNNRIQVLDPAGRPLGVFGGAGPNPGEFGQPWGVALTAAGDRIWVADTLNHRLQRFDVEATIKPLVAMKRGVK